MSQWDIIVVAAVHFLFLKIEILLFNKLLSIFAQFYTTCMIILELKLMQSKFVWLVDRSIFKILTFVRVEPLQVSCSIVISTGLAACLLSITFWYRIDVS